MVTATLDFIDDTPDSWRLALMEYHDRQQTDRLIHNFSTSKDSLKEGLQAFQVPIGDNGASEVYDAVIDGCKRIENEDAGTLSFDDADVRALIFISDGRDTSSIASLEECITAATDRRVRLYPIGFGQTVNAAPLIQMATTTGGHYYAAPTAADLVSLLQNEEGQPSNAPGRIVTELKRQIVLTYISLFQEGSHNYLISAEYQGITFPLAESAMQLHAAHLMGLNAATLLDRGERAIKELSMAKCYAVEVGLEAVNRAMQALSLIHISEPTRPY